MAFTFSGGLELQRSHRAPLKKVIDLPTPKCIILDFSADKDTVFSSPLSPGDPVGMYQRVGEQTVGGDAIPVYSGISGSVKNIIKAENDRPVGIVITSDDDQRKAELKGYEGTLAELTPEHIIEIVKTAAIPCRGSHGFAYKRLIASARIKRLIINCCESEPGTSSRAAVIAENTDEMCNGAKLIMRALGLRSCEIAVERENGILDLISKKIKKNPLFKLRKMKQKYPQDEETALIYAISASHVTDTARPEETGCAVFDAETAVAIYRAVALGIPYCERVVTVETENILCPLGTPVAELTDFCDIRVEDAVKIISGGPLRGKMFKRLDEPITSGTDAVTVIYGGEGAPIPKMTQCNRCGRCVDVCPARIMPFKIAEMSRQKRYAKCEEYGAAACCECGCCDYVCPAYIPLKKLIRTAKRKKTALKRDKNETESEELI